ncbi:MAG: aldo/keto reductase [Gemmatales bacterium]
MHRRFFLQCSSVALVPGNSVMAINGKQTDELPPLFDQVNETKKGDMRYRRLGKTGEVVSCVGIGGHHIGKIKEEAESIRVMREAIDAGISFMDNCWDYHDGLSELRMGKALQDGYRKKVFLMTKIDGRTKNAATRQLDDSLLRLRTEMIDLVQHHEMIRMEDSDRIFQKEGAQEALEAARKAGKIRYIGFTGHKDPAVHLRTLENAGRHNVRFDTVQMPLNLMDVHFRSFTRQVLPHLVKDNIGVLSMKPLASGAILESKTVTAVECLQFALSLPTSVVITGIDSRERLKQALSVVKDFAPSTPEEMRKLMDKTVKSAASGAYEGFKTGVDFDSTAKHPEWLG